MSNDTLNKKPFHHAFAITYNGIVRELVTMTLIAQPKSIDSNLNGKKFVEFKAIWDTGATNTVITQNVVDALELISTGKAEMYSVNKKSLVDTYMIDLGLPNKVLFNDVNVLCGELTNTDILIGMDIIQSGDFAISNSNGKTHFSYCCPSHKNRLCLVEKSEKVNPKIMQRVNVT